MAPESNFQEFFFYAIVPFMSKFLLLLIPLFLGGTILLGFWFISSSKAEFAALQVTATPQTEIFLDKISLGKTPLYNDKLRPGEYSLKLVPQGSSGLFNFEQKVVLRNGILTVLDRIFKTTEAESETSLISLEPINGKNASEIAVVSSPDGAEVKLDEQAEGITPLLLKEVSVSDHQISVTKSGYNNKTLRVRPVLGYRLTTSVKLSILPSSDATPSAQTQEASKSATIRILETPTRFLRVRKEPFISSPEVAKVNPDDTFLLLEEKNGWYKIRLSDGKEGWVSSQYASREDK